MASEDNGNSQMEGDGSPVESNVTPTAQAMPFTLLKLAYHACLPEIREFYDTRINGVSVDLKNCCNYLMAPGDRLRILKSTDDDPLDVCFEASYNGHLDCLQQAHVANIPWNWHTTEVACRMGHIECLDYVHKNGCETGGSISALAAACGGQISTLKYAWTAGFSFPQNICTLIARFGNLESLRYLQELGFSWDTTTTAAAASYNQLEFLKYLREQGCPWDVSTTQAAARKGNIECLKYAHTNGCEWDSSTCYAAAQEGHLDCLEYAHTNGCEWDDNTPTLGVFFNQLHCVRYALNNGCPRPNWFPWDHVLSRQ